MTTLRTPDGETLALRDWPLAAGAARAVVVLVHGLGEHAGRYGPLAARLNAWGFAARAADHHGHGASSGARGGLPSPTRLVDDLALVIDDTRNAFPTLPLVLLGHSLGGLVAASAVARGLRKVDALVLSSPALDAGLSAFQKLLVATLSRLAPGLRVGNGLALDALSHAPAVVDAYRADPLCHDRIGARLARFLANEGAAVQAAAPAWRVPTLLLYAGDDRLVNPAGSRAFADAAPQAVVSSLCFPALYHEIFNERDAEPVFDALRAWLDARFPNG
ncbi:alpha/beta hydrolase [Variovorax sp. J31P179]|uniref:alpha/beta hydrolase n=1 Tax=Variovorax sp. J31P179 TaxID=3053508 RepID=UPI002576995B|nr:alpha/beta hydrolase [Variovorax sp. J31P179]MDM0081240.1 alpha/beta hydrolase [Variovorax sp. J31P179]